MGAGIAGRAGVPVRLLTAAALGVALLAGYGAGQDPVAALQLAGAFAFTLLAFAALPIAIALLAFEPLGIAVDESLMVRMASVLLLLAALGLVTASARRWRLAPEATRVGVLIAVFVAWAALSAAWAEDPGVSLTTAGNYALGIPLAIVVFIAVRERADTRLLAAALVVGAVGSAIYAFASPRPEFDEAGRLGSGSIDPNELASLMVAGVAFAGAGVVAARRGSLWRPLSAIAAVVCLAALGATLSRGGLVALALMLAAALLLGGRWRGQIAAAGLLVAMGGFVYYSTFAPQEARDRLATTSQGEARFFEGRATLWQVAGRMIEDKPISGAGAGNFRVSARHYVFEAGTLPRTDQIIDQPRVAHSLYLQVLTELGIPGMLLLAAILGISLRAGLLAAREFALREDRAAEALARATVIGLIGVLAANLFLTQELNKQLWFLVGFGPALLALSRRRGAPAPTS